MTPREVLLAKLRGGAVFGLGDDATYDEYPEPEEVVDALLEALTAAGYDIVLRSTPLA